MPLLDSEHIDPIYRNQSAKFVAIHMPNLYNMFGLVGRLAVTNETLLEGSD